MKWLVLVIGTIAMMFLWLFASLRDDTPREGNLYNLDVVFRFFKYSIFYLLFLIGWLITFFIIIA